MIAFSRPHGLLPFFIPIYSSPPRLCPHETEEERPCQDVARQSIHQSARPEVEWAAEEGACVERVDRLAGAAQLQRCGHDAEDEKEGGRDEREGNVEEEAVVGLEAEDAGADTEEGCRQGLNIDEGLLRS